LIQETEEDNDNPYGKRDVITDLLALLKGLTSLDLSGLGLSGLGLDPDDVGALQNGHGPIGVDCSPMNGSTGSAGNCTASPMCCNDNRAVGVALIFSFPL